MDSGVFMKDNEKLDDIDTLIDQLKETKQLGTFLSTRAQALSTAQPDVNEENVNDFIMKVSSKLIQQGVDTIEVVKTESLSTANAEEVEAYAKLIAAVASAIDTLNKVNIQNKKSKSAKELKQMEIDNSKNLLDKYNGPTTQTNILIATREDVMKSMIKQAEELKVLDADYIKLKEIVDEE